MIRTAKYIVGIFPGLDGGRLPQAILFPETLKHSDIASNLRINVISAGQVRVIGNRVQVFGESISLGVRHRREDEDLVKDAIGYN